MAETASRPLSSLALTGVPPPSRTGTATRSRTATASRTASSGKDATDLLAQSLILRMRTYFKDVANDVKRQEIISQEVIAFMNRFKNNVVKEEDVAVLQERIRLKLSGAEQNRNSVASMKREMVANDEWARIFEFQSAVDRTDEQNETTVLRTKQRMFKESLTQQMVEREKRLKEEKDFDHAYFLQEQDALKKWEKEEVEKRRLQQEIIEQLKLDRMRQLTERQARKELYHETRRVEDERLASKIAYETKTEFEKELNGRLAAKAATRDLLLENEQNKKIREERKVRDAEEDARYRREWAEQLDKQERARNELVERTRRIQNNQAEMAKSRPESKVWMDPALIDRYYREAEERKTREEAERIQRRKQAEIDTTQGLAVQLDEHRLVKERYRQEEEQRARELQEKVATGEAREVERRANERAKKEKLRGDLETQMRSNALERLRAPMSEAEKQLNRGLLGNVHDWRSSGAVAPDLLRSVKMMNITMKHDKRSAAAANAASAGLKER